jgi:kumamolisin
MQGDGKRADRGGSTGGGVSSHFALPQWQEAVAVPSVNPHAAPGRCVPDVAALANFSGYLLVLDGQAQPNGGTSAAAPLWASLLGRVNSALIAAGKQRVGYVTPLLYGSGTHAGRALGQEACFDVTSGNNDTAAAVEGYAARSGYDCVTGWGSPKGADLLASLKKLL